MRRYRFLTLAMAAALVAVNAPAAAQERADGRRPEATRGTGGPATRLLEHRQELGLTEQQIQRLEAIGERQARMMARNDSIRQAARAEWKKSHEEAMALLTPEQREKVDQLLRKHRDERRKHHGRWHKKDHQGARDSIQG